MKNILYILITTILLSGCFNSPDITPPMFVPKSPPDSLIETGIDAHPDNAIYLEWEEPSSAEEDGILSYYIYRGTKLDGEYKFKYYDEVIRNSGVILNNNYYIDYNINLDTTYYYYLRSNNDYTVSRTTSDTVCYRVVNKPSLFEPGGIIYTSHPVFKFRFANISINSINNFYLKLYYMANNTYELIFYVKVYRIDLSQNKYNIYLENNNSNTTILFDNIWTTEDNKYLLDGNYRWKIDAIASRLGNLPEIEGSETDWMYFTIK